MVAYWPAPSPIHEPSRKPSGATSGWSSGPDILTEATAGRRSLDTRPRAALGRADVSGGGVARGRCNPHNTPRCRPVAGGAAHRPRAVVARELAPQEQGGVVRARVGDRVGEVGGRRAPLAVRAHRLQPGW